MFATPDPIWPIFFAVVDRNVANSLWNQCLMELPRTRYFFSVGAEPDRVWTDGAVSDFPFAHVVFGHSLAEPAWRRLWRLVRTHGPWQGSRG